jgi:hypothetical protein
MHEYFPVLLSAFTDLHVSMRTDVRPVRWKVRIYSMKRILFGGAAMLMAMSPAVFAASPPSVANPPSAPTDSGMTVGSPAEAAAAATGSDSGIFSPGTPKPPTSNIPAATTAAADMFTTVPAQDDLTSSVIGLDIYNNSDEEIGKIEDIAFAVGGVKAYIIGVGGFLGIGDHYVAVRPSAITLSYDDGTKKWHAVMNAGAAELKAAPEFKYPTAS